MKVWNRYIKKGKAVIFSLSYFSQRIKTHIELRIKNWHRDTLYKKITWKTFEQSLA